MVDTDVTSIPGRSVREYGPQLFVAVAVVVLAQSTRPLFTIMFEIGEDWDFVLAGLVALGAFAAPVLVVAIPQMRRRTALIGGSVAMAVGLISARLIEPIPAPLAILVVGAALVGVTLIVARADIGTVVTPLAAVVPVVLGLAIDVGIRAAFDSWDLVWQSGVGSLVLVLALAAGLVALAISTSGRLGQGDGVATPSSVWVGVGAYLLLQLLFLQNFAFVASQGQVSVAVAVLAVLAGDTAAITVVRFGPRLTPRSVGGLAAVVVALAWAVPLLTGVGAVLAVFISQPGLSLLLGRAAARVDDRKRGGRTVALAVAGGSLLYLAMVLLWSLHIDQPLPVPRQTVPALAALIVAGVALRGRTDGAAELETGNRAGIALLLGLTVVVPLWLVFSMPDLEAESTVAERFNLVSYNVRGAVGIDGQLAPDRIVDEILSSDPDIVVVQEAARGWPIHGTMDLVSYLQRELGMDFVYVPAADGQFGNAVFSSLPLTEVASGPLPKDGSQERAYLLLRFDIEEAPVYIAVTHLHPRSAVQVNALLDAVDGVSPLIVAGDMNIAPDDPEISLFTEAGLVDVVGATGDPCRTTSAEPTSDCDRPDWVFVTPEMLIERLRIGSGGASDHLAIHVTLGR